MADEFDVVVVGAGIAGSALACQVALAGIRVLVLERQMAYRDRVRGEVMMPWGVVEAQRLGLEQVLLDAGGGYETRLVDYDDWLSPAEAEAAVRPLAGFMPDVEGVLAVGHPQATEALSCQAASCGAVVVRDVTEVDVTVGQRPSVRYTVDGHSRQVTCRLVVGADGRHSIVRRKLGLALRETTPRTMLAGMLIAGFDGCPGDQMVLGTGSDVFLLAFPRPGGFARLYLGYDVADKDRFAGENRVRTFVEAFRVRSLSLGDAVAAATPAGPCASYPGNDTWTDQPFGPGAVLIGDAAGWSDPFIGQGLSVAFRDARIVSEVLLAQSDWTSGAFSAYGHERAQRMRRLRVVVHVMTDFRCDFTSHGRDRRAALSGATLNDPLTQGLIGAQLVGPDAVPPEVFEPSNIERVLALS
jgi:2-polyprenyl-6-methoxyphenol hydroxylase-like FAD-dependent oxidoreductase